MLSADVIIHRRRPRFPFLPLEFYLTVLSVPGDGYP